MADGLEQLLKRGYTESRIRVRYAETDQMGVVYHANYLIWLEVGRVDFLRDVGLDYASMERTENALFAVVDAHIRYKAPARYDDEVLVRTRLVEVRGSISRFTYTLVRESDGTELCECETVHMVVTREMKRRTMPQSFAEVFAKVLAGPNGAA